MATFPTNTQLVNSANTVEEQKEYVGNQADAIFQIFGTSAAGDETIATGSITPSVAIFTVDTEASATADDLDTILTTNFHTGAVIAIQAADASRVVTVKNEAGGSGQITLVDGADKDLDTDKWMLLRRNGADWVEFVVAEDIPDASETESGIIEIATQAETDAGTDDTKAITPAKLASWSVSGGEYAIFADEKANGTDGGGITTGSWQQRDLNTVRVNQISGASLSSNQFTLPAGTYYLDATASANGTNFNQIRLYNVTDSAAVDYGVNNYANTSSSHSTPSALKTAFTITGTKTFRIEARAGTNSAGDGMGRGNSFGNTEVFAVVYVAKKVKEL